MSLQRESILLDARQSFRLLRWQDNLRDVESLLSSTNKQRVTGTGDRWHYHPEMELTLIKRGQGTRFVGDHIGPFEALDVVLIGSNVPHFWKGVQDSTGYALQWHFDAAHSIWQFPETAGLKKLWQQSSYGLRFTGKTALTVLELVDQMARYSGLGRLTLFLQLLDMLTTASRRDKQRLSQQAFDLASVQTHQPAIERVIRHVLRHYQDAIRLDDVLRLAAMSRATFARQFPKHAGKTFSSFVNQVRLNAVCRELVSSNATISEIAFANGFNNLSSFNRLFLQTYQCSPKTYRTCASRSLSAD